jgi:hypothetical protein
MLRILVSNMEFLSIGLSFRVPIRTAKQTFKKYGPMSVNLFYMYGVWKHYFINSGIRGI